MKKIIKPLEGSLIHLYYLSKRSTKKYRELKKLAKDLKDMYVNNSVRPENAPVTHWIDHKMRAIGKLNDKFEVYTAHLAVIANTSKNKKRQVFITG